MKTDAILTLAAHRAVIGPGAGQDGWYHIMPLGEFEVTVTGADGKAKPATEVVDQTALEAIMARHRELAADPNWPGYLVGIEHESQDPAGRTQAAAWARELEVRDGDTAAVPAAHRGLWARLEKTPLGEGLIGSVYKFFSTVNHMAPAGDGRVRPVTIEDIGLTNKPAYTTLAPAMHRAGTPTENTEVRMEKLKALCAKHNIGVADGDDEDAMLAKIGTALAAGAQSKADAETASHRATAAEQKVADMERLKLEADADAFVAQHKAVIKDPAAVRTQFIAHRAATEALFGGLKKPEELVAPGTVLHRADGKTPTAPAAGDGQPADDVRRRERLDLVADLKSKHRCTHDQAWNLARQKRPELFREEAKDQKS